MDCYFHMEQSMNFRPQIYLKNHDIKEETKDDKLLKTGGHIGGGVRPGERKDSVITWMMNN